MTYHVKRQQLTSTRSRPRPSCSSRLRTGTGEAILQGVLFSAGGRAVGEGLETVGRIAGEIRTGSRALPAGPSAPRAITPAPIDNVSSARFSVDANGTVVELGASNGIPRGFETASDFGTFSGDLQSGLRIAGHNNMIAIFQGNSGIASPVNRTNHGFVGRGLTAGGASEFVIPNGPTRDLANVSRRPAE